MRLGRNRGKEKSIDTKAAGEVREVESLCYQGGFVAGGEFGGTLLAAEADGEPEIGIGDEGGEFVGKTLTRLNLLQSPTEVVVRKERKTTTLQRQLRYIVAKMIRYK